MQSKNYVNVEYLAQMNIVKWRGRVTRDPQKITLYYNHLAWLFDKNKVVYFVATLLAKYDCQGDEIKLHHVPDNGLRPMHGIYVG